MPRNSRQKSSKHSSREATDYSDSEIDSSLKERKTRAGSVSRRGSKESASGEKRKHDSWSADNKLFVGSGNVDIVEEYGGFSSKKRREKLDDDRWDGGDYDDRELMKTDKDSKGLNDSKNRSSRRDESLCVAINVDEGKRSGSKAESKHHRSERKEKGEREGGLERDRKAKDYSKSERLVNDDAGTEVMGRERSRKQLGEERGGKDVPGNSGINIQDDLLNPESEREVERRVRRKKDSVIDGDKYQDGGHEIIDRRMSSRDDTAKSVKYKDVGRKENGHKDKYRDDVEKDYRHPDEKRRRDGRHSRDYISTLSDDKYSSSRFEKKDPGTKKSKPEDCDREKDRGRYHWHYVDRDRDYRDHDGDRDCHTDRSHDHVRDLDADRGGDLDRERERGRDHDRDRVKDRDRERHRREWEQEWERDCDRDRDFTHDHGRELDHDHDRDYGSHAGEKTSRYKEDRDRQRSPDDYDDYHSSEKSNIVKAGVDADRERSILRRTRATDAVAGIIRGRSSPSSKSHAYVEKYRDNMLDDMKSGDSREVAGFSEIPEKSSKYNSVDKHVKLDDYHIGDLFADKSSGTKASPLVRIQKSPSASIDHKFADRPARRRSLDVDEAERRSSGSNDVRDGFANDDRQSRDMTSKKSLGEDYSSVESSIYHKPSHGNGSSLGHGPPNYWAGADSPSFMGSFGEDFRGPTGGRYRRSVDPNIGRVHGSPWKGGPNWASPISNGFMPFPPGPHGPPPHGGFPGMLPQFPSPPIFGVRPPMEMNHSGIPYHLPDMDRFPSHMRPLGWQNMVDGTGPSHFHGWDGNSCLFRDEPPFYGPGNMSNGRMRESIVESWKQNGYMISMDTTLGSKKDSNVMKPLIDEAQAGQVAKESLNKSNQHEDVGKGNNRKTPSTAQLKETQTDMAEAAAEKTCELPAIENAANSLRAYLSKLDISMELTDPVLYEEVVSLAVIKQSESIVEEKMENVNVEKEEALGLEVLDTNAGMKLLPVAEESLFQRAMDLYKTHSLVRRSSLISGGEGLNLQIPSPSSPEVKDTEQVALEEELKEEPALYNQEARAFPDTTDLDCKRTVATSPNEINTALDLDLSGKSKLEMEDLNPRIPSVKLASDNNAVTSLDISDDAEMEGVDEMRRKDKEEKSAPCAEKEMLGSSEKVSDPVILSHGSCVNKVCEDVVPPNASESVILTRIHQNARESTH